MCAMKLSEKQARALGVIPEVAPRPGSHEGQVREYPDWLLEAIIADLGKRNLRDMRDHEVRWCAERCKAARAERRRRNGGRRPCRNSKAKTLNSNFGKGGAA